MTRDEFFKLAQDPLSGDEIRKLIDDTLSGAAVSYDSLRLILASDLLCDAAFELKARDTGRPVMSKTVALNPDVSVDLSEMAIIQNLREQRNEGRVTESELRELALASAGANVISNMMADGADPSELEGATIGLTPIGLIEKISENAKPKGLFGRFFKRT